MAISPPVANITTFQCAACSKRPGRKDCRIITTNKNATLCPAPQNPPDVPPCFVRTWYRVRPFHDACARVSESARLHDAPNVSEAERVGLCSSF